MTALIDCTCSKIMAADSRRHFRGCPCREPIPEPPCGMCEMLREDLEDVTTRLELGASENRLENGDVRYLIYDALEGEWYTLARGHAPLRLMKWSTPPARFAKVVDEVVMFGKRVVVESARRVVRDLARKAEFW